MQKNIHLETKHDQPSEAAQQLPFYPYLPKDEVELHKLRIAIRDRCLLDHEFRTDILLMCSMDVAFFATIFCWIHETRNLNGREPGPLPFTPWSDQVDVLAWFQLYGGRMDMVIEKTRGIGMSWTAAIFIFWLWNFKQSIDIAVVTKDETSLDIKDRPTTFLGKLDFLFKHLPYWMQYQEGKSILHRTIQNHRFGHRYNGSAILGYTADDDKLRSGRYYLVIVDEGAFLPNDTQRFLAASQFVSPSRIWISTHNGSNTFFYRLSKDEESKLVRISLWWWENPDRRKGLYRSVKGQIETLDPAYNYVGYEFKHDHPNILRSEWFDDELSRAGADIDVMLEELNGVAAILGRKMFDEKTVEIITPTIVRAPYRGFIHEDGSWEEDPEGPFKLWTNPESCLHRGVLGCDPSVGVGHGAYAGITALDVVTGEQIMSGALRGVPPVEFARVAYGAAILLGGAHGPAAMRICWETTGSVGLMFGNELKRMKANNLYVNEDNRYGYHKSDDGEQLLLDVKRGAKDGELRIKDEDTLDDLTAFEYNREFEFEYAGTDGHGDRAIAMGVAWYAGQKRRRALARPRSRPETPTTGPDAELKERNRFRRRRRKMTHGY